MSKMGFSAGRLKHYKWIFFLFIVVSVQGAITFGSSPMLAYPEMEQTHINISTTYPGANSLVVEEAVLSQIEEELLKLPNLRYIDSSANNRGGASITVAFNDGMDKDSALLDVQNAISAIEPRLPLAVKNSGISVSRGGNIQLLSVNLTSPDNSYSRLDLSDYAKKYLVKDIAKIEGVTNVEIFGEMKKSVRVWADPQKMQYYDVDSTQLIEAIKVATGVYALGALGEPPSGDLLASEYILSLADENVDLQSLSRSVIRFDPSGFAVRVGHVADVKMGSEFYGESSAIDGASTVGIGVFQNSTGNVVRISESVYEWMARSADNLPKGISIDIAYDTSRYVKATSREVMLALALACLIVILVVGLALGSIKETIIPAVVIPISLLTTIAVISWLGITLNLVLLLGMILATGVVVDDAILVVERVDYLRNHKKVDLATSIKLAMSQLFNPIITTTVIISVVFLPYFFVGSYHGLLYQQFSIVMILSVVISTLVALCVSPYLCSVLIPESTRSSNNKKRAVVLAKKHLNFFYSGIINLITGCYRSRIAYLLLLCVVVLTTYLFNTIKHSFVPNEDTGYLVMVLLMPETTPLAKTEKKMQELTQIIRNDPGVVSTFDVNGWNYFRGNGSSNAISFIKLLDWSERGSSELANESILERLKSAVTAVKGADIFILMPQTVPGLSSYGSFNFKIIDLLGERASLSDSAISDFVQLLNQQVQIESVQLNSAIEVPQIKVAIDKQKAYEMGVNLLDIYDTLKTYFGSSHISDFTYEGAVHKVILQADVEFRSTISDIQYYFVRSSNQELVSLSHFVTLDYGVGAGALSRYDGSVSVSINGVAEKGNSVVDTIALIDTLKSELPARYKLIWSNDSQRIKDSASNLHYYYLAAVFLIYLALLILYGSWVLPLGLVLTAVIPISGSIFLLWLFNLDLNLYSNVGILLSMGLFIKAAVLVIERAKNSDVDIGSGRSAVWQACVERVRPVYMTSVSFLAGIIPMLFFSGPGTGAREALAISLVGGVLFSCILSPLIVPRVLADIFRLSDVLNRRKHSKPLLVEMCGDYEKID